MTPPVDPAESPTPLILVKGDATAEEVAALVAVIQGVAAAGAAAGGDPAPVSQWASLHRRVRTAYPHGPGGWRASALPR